MKITDPNGRTLRRDVRRETLPGGRAAWGVSVWFGGAGGVATTVRRHYYASREQARAGDISDDVGSRGRVSCH